MKQFLPVLTLLTPTLGQGIVPHISEKQFNEGRFEVSSSNREHRGLEDLEDSSTVPSNNYKKCRLDTADSLYNYFSEDIEKENNVSMSTYEGNVTLVVNLASF